MGETPLSALNRLREERSQLAGLPLTYAGRLDPMASGKLLVLIGEECKKREKYLELDKEYEVEVLFGLGSDTGDILGLINLGERKEVTKSLVENALKKYVGDIEMPYPVFSSKTVGGKPLFQWALENKLGEIDIPTRRSKIYKIETHGLREITKEDLKREVFEKINLLPTVTEPSKQYGRDFRRKEVFESWEMALGKEPDKYFVAKISVACSSGTYMRSIAQLLGKDLGTSALALSITRTKIG